jgi:molecular chaperone DnaK (HSP70)
MEPIVGMDLGTTNSEVAFIVNGNAEILKENDHGIVPSYVGLDDTGNVIVGQTARNQHVIAPERTIASIKRLMGSEQQVTLNGVPYRPQEISAFILKALKERAERILKQDIHKAVITVPAYFTDAQRQATKEAGQIAGLEVVRMIHEPTAAALAYEGTHSSQENILVYDLGGGTFDVSIVSIESGVVEVLSSAGDNYLGGDDFDRKIIEHLIEHIETDLKLSAENHPLLMARLKRAAENAKIQLSTEPYATIEEDHIGKKFGKDIHLNLELSRSDFMEMIQPDLDRTLDAVSTALRDASLLAGEIDKMILVGGSTHIPAISDMLQEKIGRVPYTAIDPDQCVALGAAIQAGREMGLDTAGVLIDITPYTFGTSAFGQLRGELTRDMYVPIIHRNTKLPVSKSEVFFTMYPHQELVEINIFQGEAPNAQDNVKIGKYLFHLPKLPENSPVILHFDLDLNGVLRIEAVEKQSGVKINATIENAFTAFSREDMEISRRKIDDMWRGPECIRPESPEADSAEEETRAAGNMPEEIRITLRQAKAMLEEEVPAEDIDEIVNLMEDIRTAVRENRLDDAREYQQMLEDILFYLE